MAIPPKIRAGDTIKWRDNSTTDVFGNAISSPTWVVTYYLRTNTLTNGATVVGTTYTDGWEFEISSGTSTGFIAGEWYWQAIATKSGAEPYTVGTGQVEVLPALKFTGTAPAFDGRSQTKKDLDTVKTAIMALISGGAVQEYKIGSRSAKKYDLAELRMLESSLKAQLHREEAAEQMANGLGNPRSMFVRFK